MCEVKFIIIIISSSSSSSGSSMPLSPVKIPGKNRGKGITTVGWQV